MASLGLGWLAQPVFMTLLSPLLAIGVFASHSKIGGVTAACFPGGKHFLQIVLENWGQSGSPFRIPPDGAVGRRAVALVLSRLLPVQLIF